MLHKSRLKCNGPITLGANRNVNLTVLMLTPLIMNQPYSHWPPFTVNTLTGASLTVFTNTLLSTLLHFLVHLLIIEMTCNQCSCVTAQTCHSLLWTLFFYQNGVNTGAVIGCHIVRLMRKEHSNCI